MAVQFRHVVAVSAALAGGLTVAVVARSTPSHAFRSAVPATDLSRIPWATGSMPPPPSTGGAASGHVSSWGGPLMVGLVLAAVVIVVGLIARLGRSPQHGAGTAGRPLVSTTAQPKPAPDERLLSALDEGCAALARGPVREAVVACWILLEDAAARAGLALDPAETATDFAARVRRSRGVPEPRLHRLAELYREARFSDHPMDEAARAEAQACVAAIRAQLRGAGARG
jgi:hypothetical protein